MERSIMVSPKWSVGGFYPITLPSATSFLGRLHRLWPEKEPPGLLSTGPRAIVQPIESALPTVGLQTHPFFLLTLVDHG